MKRKLLSALMAMSLSPLLQALDCSGGLQGPCQECPVGVQNLTHLQTFPPLYWDVCRNPEVGSKKVIHFLPSRVSAVIKNGKHAQAIRTLPNGDIRVLASLQFYPWAKDTDTDQDQQLNGLRQRFPGVLFQPVVPVSYSTVFYGRWQDWIRTTQWNEPSGVTPFSQMTLALTFKAEFANQVRIALSRDLGILGQVTFLYKGYSKNGELLPEFRHPMALHLGSLKES